MRSFLALSLVSLLFFCVLFSGCMQEETAPKTTTTSPAGDVLPVTVSGAMKISKPGLYQLAADLVPSSLNKTNSMEYSCIDIRSSGVTFDGMGHTVDGKYIATPCQWSDTYDSRVCEYSNAIRVSSRSKDTGDSPVVIRNVTVSNWSRGVKVINAKNVLLENLEITGNEYAVNILYSTNITIQKNRIAGRNNCGIEGLDSANLTIAGNTITDNRNTGIVLSGIVTRSVSVTVPDILKPVLGDVIYFRPFTTTNERYTSGGGYIIVNNFIGDNKGDAIDIIDSNNDLIGWNTITDTRGTGIHLKHVDATAVTGNTIANSSSRSILIINCGPDLRLSNNTMSGNYENVETYDAAESVSLTMIIGTFLVYLFKVLSGATGVFRKFEEWRTYGWIKKKFASFDDRMQSKAKGHGAPALFGSWAVVTVIGGIIIGCAFAYTSSMNVTVVLFACLVLVSALVTVTPRAAQYLTARRAGIPVEFRLWWGGIIIILLTTFIPKIVFGQSVRVDLADGGTADRRTIGKMALTGPAVCILLSACFFLSYLFRLPDAFIPLEGLKMSMLAALVMMLPISPMDGEQVFRWDKRIWAAVFVPVLLAYGYILIVM